MQAFPIQHLPVAQAQQQLSQALGDSVEIVPDPAKNRLIVSGSDEAIRITGNLLATIDRPTNSITNTATSRSASTYTVPANSQTELTRYLESLYTPAAGLSITANAGRNELTVIASPQVQGEIAEILASRGIRKAGAINIDKTPATRSVGLRRIDWRRFEASLVSTWGNRLSVQSLMQGQRVRVILPHTGADGVAPVEMLIDRSANQITLQGATTLVDAWTRAIARLDEGEPAARAESAWIAVARPSSPDLKQALSYLRLSGESDTTTGTTIRARNASFAGTPSTRPASFQEPAAPAGVPTPGAPQGQAPQGQGGEPGADGSAPGQGGEQAQGALGPVQLEFIEELGIVVVKGDPKDVARVRQLIQEIEDLANATVPTTELVMLKSVDSQAVATIAQGLYDNAFAVRQGNVTVTPLVKPNAVLIVGPEESVKFLKGLIDQLDQDAPPESEFRVFRLKYMSSEDMRSRINEFYLGISSTGFAGQGIQQGERPGLGTRVRVISDYRSNSLIITASPRDLVEIERLIQELDTVQSEATNSVKIFRLRNALAEQLQPVLQDALNGQLQGAGIGANPGGTGAVGQQNLAGGIGQQTLARLRSAMLALKMIDAEGNVIEGGIMYDVRVTADINSNALIVTGPEENMALIEALINSLDQLPEVETKIKVFPVLNNDAGVLLQLLNDLFSTQNQGGGQQQGGLSQLPLQSAGDGESNLVGLRFAADPRTNTIIASGSEANLRVVEDLVYRLDQDDLHQRIVKVFRLRNTISTSVQTAIQGWLDARATLYGDGGDVVGVPFNREVIIVDEPEGNSLIVSTTPEYYAEVEKIIEDLDRRPMFMIRALIAEVALGDNEEFGIEMGIQDSLVFDRGIGTIGFPFNQAGIGNNNTPASLATRENLAGQGLSNLSIGRTNADLGFGGLVLSAGNESVNLLLRALKQRGRLQVLSSPTIMTMDNLQGYVQVGSEVRFISGTTITNGISQNTVEVAEIGIILQVRPRLSPDGMIVMEVDATKSDLGNEADGTTVGFAANGDPIRVPPVNITTAQTTIMARDGQTVVFAGLITSSDQQEMRGVPILSDIPAIGRLFRYDAQFQQRTELMIILTPYVVENEADIAAVNQMSMDRMSWCMADVASIYGPVGYDDGSMIFENSPTVVYPDLTPTGEGSSPTPVPDPSMGPVEGTDYLPPGIPTPVPPQGSSLLPSSRRQAMMGSPDPSLNPPNTAMGGAQGTVQPAMWRPGTPGPDGAPVDYQPGIGNGFPTPPNNGFAAPDAPGPSFPQDARRTEPASGGYWR